MPSLSKRLAAMNALLGPLGTRHDSRGRVVAEPDDDIRTPFERDRARIIHSQAFRRLAGKTQVFVTGEGDHYRTRLTHTMEVAQITRDLARALGLNDDLAECIALAHDLGHPPFGHSGQDALDAWMRSTTNGREGFEHNLQSHRIVTVLETRGQGNGLNLTRDVVEGLLKHGGLDAEDQSVHLSRESLLANACDEIAYTAHDTDDGIRAGLFTTDELLSIPLAAEAAARATARGTLIRSTLIDLLARDLLAHSERSPDQSGLSPEVRAALAPLRAFLWERVYHHPSVVARMQAGQAALLTLCKAYQQTPPPAVLALQERTGSSLHEAVKDYVAGMTDIFATRATAHLS